MKTHSVLPQITAALVVWAFATPLGAQSPAPTAEAHYKSGIAAEKTGDAIAAGKHYDEALKLDPKHANARYSLGQLKIHSGSIATKSRETKFGNVIIPVFQLDEASLQESLAAFGSMIEKESKETVIPNFVIEDPQKRLASQKISLNLKGTPARAIMKYLMDQSGGKARYDEHAVVISPK